MRPVSRLAPWIVLAAVAGCQDTIDPGPMRSLERSGRVSLLCREHATGTGRDLRACPDPDDLVSDGEDRRLMMMVTQTLRGEVAVIDTYDRVVVDEDPSMPGIEFLPVGANPTAIVSTPGGVATFVATAEPSREALFALPSTCITPPQAGDPSRELTLWAACRLPVAAGEMAIVTDPSPAVEGETGSDYRALCDGVTDEAWQQAARLPIAKRRTDCPANLEAEEHVGKPGRRKLLVTLPDLGQVAVYDAQALLNQPPGAFPNCVPDMVLALRTVAPLAEQIEQRIPEDLVPDPACTAPRHRYEFGPVAEGAAARPAGMAVGDSHAYLSDLGVPVVHDLDLSDVCSMKELDSLVPLAYDDPGRQVLTRDLALSGLTQKGERFLYAVDDADGSAMVFDVSEGSTDRTPIVRPGTPYFPFEPPDRIRLDSPIRDLAIVTHDVPAVDSSTDIGTVGVMCDPSPTAKKPGSLYQTESDYSGGASPHKLRGTFAMLGLTSGQIVAVDIEDFDAPCRRPLANNPDEATIDYRGCAHSSSYDGARFEDKTGEPTVSREASCNIVSPHRVRSGGFLVTSPEVGSFAPGLASFPRLSSTDAGDLPSGQSETGRQHPKLLAVPFVASNNLSTPPELYVGTSTYTLGEDADAQLLIDPAKAEVGSLFLPVLDPRLYAANEDFTAIYEGSVVPQRETGQLPVLVDAMQVLLPRPLGDNELLLIDADAVYCDQGVQDASVTRDVGAEFGLGSQAAFDAFVRDYTDYVLLEGDFDSDEPYFKSDAAAKACGVEDLVESCEQWFGTAEDPLPARELRVVEAYDGQLILEPRSAQDPATRLSRIHCCFPSVHSYSVRAGHQWVVRGNRLLHDMERGPGFRCIRDCKPRRKMLRGRAFEISSSDPICAEAPITAPDMAPPCSIGPAVAGDVCVVEQTAGAVDVGTLGRQLPTGCVFDSLKGRFAVYRGMNESVRGMTYAWTVVGGFYPLSASLVNASSGASVLLENMLYSEQLSGLVTVDGESGGVGVVGLESLTLRGNPYQ